MANHPTEQDSEPPKQFPSVPAPQDLHATSDIRFVMIEMGKFASKVDRLVEDVGKQTDRLGLLERSADRLKTAVIVASAIISVVAIVFWWALGDRITAAVHNGLLTAPSTELSKPPQK